MRLVEEKTLQRDVDAIGWATRQDHEAPDFVFTPDGGQFVTLWSEPGEKPVRPGKVPKFKREEAALFETSTGQTMANFSDRAGVHGVALSPDGLWLATTTWHGIAFELWSLRMRKPLVTVTPRLIGLQVPLLETIRFAAQGREIVVCDRRKGLLFTYQLSSDSPSKVRK